LGLHENLLAEIQDRVSKWNEKQLIGDIFVKNVRHNYFNSEDRIKNFRKQSFLDYHII